MITVPAAAFGAIDRQEPVDDRSDLEIEIDAAERARAKREAERIAKLLATPRPDALWDAVNAKRLAEKNQHVHPVFRDVLKRFG